MSKSDASLPVSPAHAAGRLDQLDGLRGLSASTRPKPLGQGRTPAPKPFRLKTGWPPEGGQAFTRRRLGAYAG